MKREALTIDFDLDNEIDKRVFHAIKKLPAYFDQPDMSRSLISFINDVVMSLYECESRCENCERLMRQMVGKHGWN